MCGLECPPTHLFGDRITVSTTVPQGVTGDPVLGGHLGSSLHVFPVGRAVLGRFFVLPLTWGTRGFLVSVNTRANLTVRLSVTHQSTGCEASWRRRFPRGAARRGHTSRGSEWSPKLPLSAPLCVIPIREFEREERPGRLHRQVDDQPQHRRNSRVSARTNSALRP